MKKLWIVAFLLLPLAGCKKEAAQEAAAPAETGMEAPAAAPAAEAPAAPVEKAAAPAPAKPAAKK